MKKLFLLVLFGLMFTVSNSQAVFESDVGEINFAEQPTELIILNHDVVNLFSTEYNVEYQTESRYSYKPNSIIVSVTKTIDIDNCKRERTGTYLNILYYNPLSRNRVVAFNNPVRRIAERYYYPEYY